MEVKLQLDWFRAFTTNTESPTNVKFSNNSYVVEYFLNERNVSGGNLYREATDEEISKAVINIMRGLCSFYDIKKVNDGYAFAFSEDPNESLKFKLVKHCSYVHIINVDINNFDI
jgi:hypothetical protein